MRKRITIKVKKGKKLRMNKKRRNTLRNKKGGGWVSDLYLLKHLKRNFFPSKEEKEEQEKNKLF